MFIREGFTKFPKHHNRFQCQANAEHFLIGKRGTTWAGGSHLHSKRPSTYYIIRDVGIEIINHPPNHHKWMVLTIKNWWFIFAVPTISLTHANQWHCMGVWALRFLVWPLAHWNRLALGREKDWQSHMLPAVPVNWAILRTFRGHIVQKMQFWWLATGSSSVDLWTWNHDHLFSDVIADIWRQVSITWSL